MHGDRVTVIGEHFDGTHAELIAIAAEQVFPLDDDISFETAAAFPLVFETAYRMLVTREAIREGNWALIWGIGGGVATASFEICRAFGVNTIVTSGSPTSSPPRASGAPTSCSTTTPTTSSRP